MLSPTKALFTAALTASALACGAPGADLKEGTLTGPRGEMDYALEVAPASVWLWVRDHRGSVLALEAARSQGKLEWAIQHLSCLESDSKDECEVEASKIVEILKELYPDQALESIIEALKGRPAEARASESEVEIKALTYEELKCVAQKKACLDFIPAPVCDADLTVLVDAIAGIAPESDFCEIVTDLIHKMF